MMGFLSGLCDGVIFEARPLRLLYNLAGFIADEVASTVGGS